MLSLWLPFLLMPSLVAGQVWIEVPDATPDQLLAAEQGCRRALGAGSCHASATPPEAPAEHRVRVEWDAEHLRASLRFDDPNDGDGSPDRREIVFSERDPEPARFEAIGLVAAAYVIGRGQREPPAVPAGASARPSALGPERDARSRGGRWAVDLLVGAGPALDRGDVRLLAGLRGVFWPIAGPLVLVGQLEGARRFADPTFTWWSGGLGAGVLVPTPFAALALQVSLAAVAEHVSVSADDPTTGASAQASRIRWGARLGFEGLLCHGSHVCLLGGVRLSGLLPAIRLEVADREAARQSGIGIDGLIGLRLAD